MRIGMGGKSAMARTLTLCRVSANSIPRRASFSFRTSNLTPRQNPIATPRLFRRELSSFKPFHTAIASSYLVSKLPCEASTSTEGRFANYISPI